MCTVSFIGDSYRDSWPGRWPQVPTPLPNTIDTFITRGEFEALRAEVQELRKLLMAAKAFDAATGQPDCEVDEKVAFIRQLADLLGVDMDGVFTPHGPDFPLAPEGFAGCKRIATAARI